MLARSMARSALRGNSASSTIVRSSAAFSQSRTSTSNASHQTILEQQRLRRPIAPHLSIYQPQLTWYMSALNRVTGVMVSAGAYGFFAAYAVSPLLGWHLESTALAEHFGALPDLAKSVIKTTVALPFTYHSWNGLRHLLWDTGKALTLKGVYATGYTVIGLTVVSSLYLGFAA